MSILISDGLVLGSPGTLPLEHPRIFYDDIVHEADMTVSSEEEGFEAVNLADFLTWDFWRPTSMDASIIFDLEEAREVNYAMIAAHTIGSCKASVAFDAWNGSAWVEMASASPGADSVFACLFESFFSSRFRVRLIEGYDALDTPFDIPAVGVLMMGKALEIERKLFRQHVPITFGRKTLIRPQASEGGKWLGRSIQRDGVATSIMFSNLTSAWVREKLDPFIKVARSQPFGWAWRPGDYPAEVAYVWTVADIAPQNTGPRDLMNVSFKVEGIVD